MIIYKSWYKLYYGLGLRKIHHTVELQDTPEIRGMINAVNFLLKVES